MEIEKLKAITLSQIEKKIPLTSSLSLPTEYQMGDARLLMLMGGQVKQNMGLNLDNFNLLLAISDLLRAEPTLNIDLFRPALDDDAYSQFVLFRTSDSNIRKRFSIEQGGESSLQQYTSQFDRRTVFPRDIVLMTANIDGSQNHTIVSEPQARKFPTYYAFALSMESVSGISPLRVPIHVEGGNLVISNNFVFSLQDLCRKNGIESIREGSRKIETPNGSVDFDSKEIVILDEDFKEEPNQRVFHLDLLLNVVLGRDGNEYFLLASLEKAKHLLKQIGYLSSKGFNAGKWNQDMGYPQFTNRDIQSRAMEMVSAMTTLRGERVLPAQIKKYSAQLESAVGFPKYAFQDIGINLQEYFSEANFIPTQQYINTIFEKLIHLGIPAERIIKIPSLLFCENFHEINYRDRGLKIVSTRKIPLYSPVNGIYRINSQTVPEFITGGGIRLLDDEVARSLEEIGIQHIALPSLLGLGYSMAGFRCTAVPW
jgi:hypothetical protein